VPGIYIPPQHPTSSQSGQGDAGKQFHKFAGLFWPQGDPGQLRQAAQAWRAAARSLRDAGSASQAAAGQVQALNQGPAIDAFGRYWGKWQGGGGYFEVTAGACEQMATALEHYASAIDQARQRVEEIAATAATVIGIGIVLTVVTVGISDAAAGAASAGLVAAAAAVGVDLSATVASIAGTILAGAAIGTVASMTIDAAVQIEHVDVFHDQKGFNWGELGQSAELGALTGGAGSGFALGARALAPILTDAVPALGKMADGFGALPGWAQSGIRGGLVGGGMAAGIDQLTSGHVNPLDIVMGATSGALGDVVAGGGGMPPRDGQPPTAAGDGRWPVDINGYVIQERDLQFLGLTREQVTWWANREAPLGMTPEQYQEFRSELVATLRAEGISPDQVDVRLQGSGANFFSSLRKPMFTEQDLAGNPEALARLQQWFGDDANRPARRPFDTAFKLGLDPFPSDYDVNVSSTPMVDQARAWWEANGGVGELIPSDRHGYLVKEAVAGAFPQLDAWHARWSQILGRDVSYALFHSEGPWDTMVRDNGVSVHFRDTDWIVLPVQP
jgi:hypothetical protein